MIMCCMATSIMFNNVRENPVKNVNTSPALFSSLLVHQRFNTRRHCQTNVGRDKVLQGSQCKKNTDSPPIKQICLPTLVGANQKTSAYIYIYIYIYMCVCFWFKVCFIVETDSFDISAC